MHATALEILMTGFASWGVWVTYHNYISAERDCLAVERSQFNGSRRIIALRNLRIEYALMQVQVVLLFLGIVSLFLPPPPFPPALDPMSRQMAFGSMLVRVGLTYISVRLTLLSRKNYTERELIVAVPKAGAATLQRRASDLQAAATHAQDEASTEQDKASTAWTDEAAERGRS